MKKTCNNNALLALFLVILCFQSFQITIQSESSNHYMTFETTTEEQVNENSVSIPNLRKLVKPFYEKPFEPTYVNSISERKRVIASPTMSRVETLSTGMTADEVGFREKPVIYTTVVQPKNTSIKHSSDVNYELYKEAKQRTAKEVPKAQKQNVKSKLRPGQFSIPVMVAGNAVRKDPTKQEYLKPNFERSSSFAEKELNQAPQVSGDIYYDAFKRIAEHDQILIQRATEGSDKTPASLEKKIENLMVARKMIKTETKDLLLKLRNKISKLEETKEVNAKLNELLDKFLNSVKDKDSLDVSSLLKSLESSLSNK